MKDYKIITKGGTMCFYGEWFGRPYDNFHRVRGAMWENNSFKIFFAAGEILSVVNPSEMTDTEKCLTIKQADEIIWKYRPDCSEKAEVLIYKKYRDGHIVKVVSGVERTIFPENMTAVQCVTY